MGFTQVAPWRKSDTLSSITQAWTEILVLKKSIPIIEVWGGQGLDITSYYIHRGYVSTWETYQPSDIM